MNTEVERPYIPGESWAVEVKHDTLERKWHRLSVTLYQPMSSVAAQYAAQYAIDRQYNASCVGFALVNKKKTGERIEHLSDSVMNRP